MSRIQITELESPITSKLNTLSEAETTQVLGGRYFSYGHHGFDFSAYISSKFKIDLGYFEGLSYSPKDATYKIDIGGETYSFTSQYKHGSNSYNYVSVK